MKFYCVYNRVEFPPTLPLEVGILLSNNNLLYFYFVLNSKEDSILHSFRYRKYEIQRQWTRDTLDAINIFASAVKV
jgi:hypothetical protein